jgi:hypothetical protein
MTLAPVSGILAIDTLKYSISPRIRHRLASRAHEGNPSGVAVLEKGLDESGTGDGVDFCWG